MTHDTTVKPIIAAKSAAIGKYALPPVAYLVRSVKYVRGETKQILLANPGNSLKGTKTPLMKMRGNLTKELII